VSCRLKTEAARAVSFWVSVHTEILMLESSCRRSVQFKLKFQVWNRILFIKDSSGLYLCRLCHISFCNVLVWICYCVKCFFSPPLTLQSFMCTLSCLSLSVFICVSIILSNSFVPFFYPAAFYFCILCHISLWMFSYICVCYCVKFLYLHKFHNSYIKIWKALEFKIHGFHISEGLYCFLLSCDTI
jgi:hypothetical protein